MWSLQSSLEYLFLEEAIFSSLSMRPSTKGLHNVFFYIDPNWGTIYKTGIKQDTDLRVRSSLSNFWSCVLFHHD